MRKLLPKTLPLIPLMTLINTDPIGLAVEVASRDTKEHHYHEGTEDHEKGIFCATRPIHEDGMPMPLVPR
jgi:hypothetical protein